MGGQDFTRPMIACAADFITGTGAKVIPDHSVQRLQCATASCGLLSLLALLDIGGTVCF